MQVIEVLNIATKLLDMPDSVISDGKDTEVISLLVRSFNNVVGEIAEEYLPIYKKESIRFKKGVLPLSSLSERLYKVKSITKEGKQVRFYEEGGNILTEKEDVYDIVYSYIPKEVGVNDEIELPPSITPRTLAYGVAGEYALISGRYEECVNYDNRFMTAMTACLLPGRERRLPYRRWI